MTDRFRLDILHSIDFRKMEPTILPPASPSLTSLCSSRVALYSGFSTRCIISLSSHCHSMCPPGSSVTILSGTLESVGAVFLTIVLSCGYDLL
jgi:hypothetical protein